MSSDLITASKAAVTSINWRGDIGNGALPSTAPAKDSAKVSKESSGSNVCSVGGVPM